MNIIWVDKVVYKYIAMFHNNFENKKLFVDLH